jgi:CO dehydrogenase nickel-insertion accessory protein CooC1
VIGGGAVQGCETVDYLKKKHRAFILIDTDPNCLVAKWFGLKQSTAIGETGEFFLNSDLDTSLALITDSNLNMCFQQTQYI